MNKKIIILIYFFSFSLALKNSYPNIPAVAGIVSSTPKTSMIKGTSQNITASNIEIKKTTNNKNLSVINLTKSFHRPLEITITALNPGTAEIVVEQYINGNRIRKRYSITVKEETPKSGWDSFLNEIKKEWNKL